MLLQTVVLLSLYAINFAREYPSTSFASLVGVSTAVGLTCVYAFDWVIARLRPVWSNWRLRQQ